MIETIIVLKHHVLSPETHKFNQNFLLFCYRVCTKVRRVWTQTHRVYTRVLTQTSVLKPCLDESPTVFARNSSVSRRKFIRESTKVNREYALISPCLSESGNQTLSSDYPNSASFLPRMYVSILLNYKFLLTTTYKQVQKSNYRVYTKNSIERGLNAA